MRESSGIAWSGKPIGYPRRPSARGGAHDLADLAHEAADALKHPLALDGVGLHDLPFVRIELPRLVDDRLGDRDVPRSCSSAPNSRLRRRRTSRPSAFSDGQSQNPPRPESARRGVAVVGGHRVTQQQSGTAVGLVELDQAPRRCWRSWANIAGRPSRGTMANTAVGVACICSATTSATPDSAASIRYTQLSRSCARMVASRAIPK